jgi:hypothetical protein
LDKDKAMMIVDECIQKNICVGVAIDDSHFIYTHREDFFDNCIEFKDHWEMKKIDKDDYCHYPEIHKIYIGLREEKEDELISLHTSGLHHARYHPESLMVEPDDKYKGILEMIHLIGGKEEDIVVFGDGHNDLSMMQQAPIAIAMGNAIDELKAVATFITKDCTENGIEYACQHFGWI